MGKIASAPHKCRQTTCCVSVEAGLLFSDSDLGFVRKGRAEKKRCAKILRCSEFLCLEFPEILGQQRLLRTDAKRHPPNEGDPRTDKKSTIYSFSRGSDGLRVDATTLYFWILVADVQSYPAFVCSVLSESASSFYVVFCVLVVYGMSLHKKKDEAQVITSYKLL